MLEVFTGVKTVDFMRVVGACGMRVPLPEPLEGPFHVRSRPCGRCARGQGAPAPEPGSDAVEPTLVTLEVTVTKQTGLDWSAGCIALFPCMRSSCNLAETGRKIIFERLEQDPGLGGVCGGLWGPRVPLRWRGADAALLPVAEAFPLRRATDQRPRREDIDE